MEIVVATRNKAKFDEIRRILKDTPTVLQSLADYPGCPDVEEDAGTFEGNAEKKATMVSRFTGKPALADDSGLEVSVLGGAPGVFSARYAGDGADDAENVRKLLSEMSGYSEEQRDARFVCSIILAFPDAKSIQFSGLISGTIGTEPRGSGGFGYDPVFFPEGSSLTFAEMSPDEKDEVSHRSCALRQVAEYLKKSPCENRNIL